MSLRNFSNTAVETTLAVSAADTDTSLQMVSVTGYPTPPFTITVDPETISEEIALVTDVVSNTFICTRGYDGTSAVAHNVGAVVRHAAVAIDFRESNTHVNDTTAHVPTQTGNAGKFLSTDGSAASWTVAPEAQQVIPFAKAGVLSVSEGKARFRFPFDATVLGVSAAIDTAPAGADIIIDVNKNGTTLFTTQGNRPRIVDGANACTEVTIMDVTACASGDYLTVDVDQIGSVAPGSDITVFIRYQKV